MALVTVPVSDTSDIPTICSTGLFIGNLAGWLYYVVSNGEAYACAVPVSSQLSLCLISKLAGIIVRGTSKTASTGTYSDRIDSHSLNRISGSYYYNTSYYLYNNTANLPVYDSVNAAIADYPDSLYPITYRLTNCTAPTAPTEAIVGDTVTVPFQFTSGYGIVNPSDVYVTNNGVVVPSQYSNGVLTFTMPDPS